MISDRAILKKIEHQPRRTAGYKQLVHELGLQGNQRRELSDHLRDLIAIYRENQRAAVNENEAPLFSFDSNFFYVHALISLQMQLPLALVFVAGLVYSLFRCRKESVILYLWLLSGIISFALVANKDVRYTVPVLPAAAVLSVCWLREFKPTTKKLVAALKPALVAILTAWALVSFFNAQWPRPGFGKAIYTPRYIWMVFARNYYGFDHRPLDDDWSVPEIVQTVSSMGREAGPDDSPPVLGVVVNIPYLSPSSVSLYARLMAKQRAGPPLVDVRWVVEPSMMNRIDECDYVLVRTDVRKGEWVATVEQDVERLIRENPGQFKQIARYTIPLAEAVVYQIEKR